jgi:Domain of unknown function (DUF4148)
MKHLLLAMALVAGSASISTFAQTAAPAAPRNDTAHAASNDAVAAGGQWVPPSGQPTTHKTRAQVYRELVQAERDGQMARLNSTVYFGS